jgi:hypothetical protein
MLQAQLHGKAPSELTWSEDMLTSNIFGLLKYLSTPGSPKEIDANLFFSARNPLQNRSGANYRGS